MVSSSAKSALTKKLRARIDELAEGMAAQIKEHVPDMGDQYDVSGRDLLRSCRGNLEFKIDSLTEEADKLDYSEPRRTGRRRAKQSVPLTLTQAAFRISFEYYWKAVLEEGRALDDLSDSDLLDLASEIWSLHQLSTEAMVDEYDRTRTERISQLHQAKTALLDSLFDHGVDSALAERELSKRFGFTEPGTFVVVALSQLASDNDPRDWELFLQNRARIRSVWKQEHGTLYGLVDVGSPDGVAPLLRAYW